MLKEREAEYGNFGDVSAVSQAFKSFVRNRWGGEVASIRQEESLDMICNKLARIICGNARNPDHWRDIAGYAMLIVKELDE